MMKWRGCLLIIVTAIVFSLIGGCSSSEGKTAGKASGDERTTTKASNSTADAKNTNAWGWEVPKETVEINFYRGRRSPDLMKKNSKVFKEFLLEEFNVDINAIVYDIDMVERLNLMLASNDYPECIIRMPFNEAMKWIDMGKALELTSLVDQYGPNIKNRYGNYLNRYKDSNGKLYRLASGWGISLWADYAPQLRWDWYNEIGAPKFETPDEYYDVIKQLVKKHPTNAQGEKTYAFGNYKSGTDLVVDLLNDWGGMFGFKKGWQVDSNNNLTYWANTNEGMDMIKFYNRAYREGLYDPDSFAMNLEQWGEKCTNERYAGFVGAWWVTGTYGHEQWKPVKGDAYHEEMRFMHVFVKAPGVENATYNPKNTIGWGSVILTDKCKNPENYIKWFNFENTDLGSKLVGWGLPNYPDSVWNYDYATGKWSWDESQKEIVLTDTAKLNWDAINELGSQCQFLMTAGTEPMVDGTYIWFDQSLPDKWKKMKDENLADSIYDFSAYESIVIPFDDPVADKNQRVKDLASSYLTKAVTANTEEDCEALIEKLRSELKNAGIDKLEKFYTDSYKENIANWEN